MNYKHHLPDCYKFPYRSTKDLSGIKALWDFWLDFSHGSITGTIINYTIELNSINCFLFIIRKK